MPTKNPRVHVVLEEPLFKRLKKRARQNRLSMSLEAREIIRSTFRSSAQSVRRVYDGRNIQELIGAFRMGKLDADEGLSRQVHG